MRSPMKNILFVLLIIGTLPVHAALVTDTWQANIYAVNLTHSNFVVGDTIQWTVTYDDAGTEMHRFDDTGSNILITYTMPNSSYSYYSDAVFDFGSIFTEIQNNQTLYDMYGWNASFTTKYQYDPSPSMSFYDDSFIFVMQGSSGFGYATVSINYYGNPANQTINFRTPQLVSHTTNTVPLPAAAWLFGSGMLGLIGISRHKKAMTA